jgi:hypothetical protein
MLVGAVALGMLRIRAVRNSEAGAIIEKFHCEYDNGKGPPPFAYELPHVVSDLLWPRYTNASVRFGWGSHRSAGVGLRDEGLRELCSLRHLHVLCITPDNMDLKHPITDAGIKHLARCHELDILAVTGTHVTDAALETIGTLGRLRELGLAGTAVTDAGMRHLTRLRALQWLSVVDTQLTDGAVEFIGEIKSLAEVHVERTRVTGDGADRLRALLPKARVDGPWNDTAKGAIPVLDQ